MSTTCKTDLRDSIPTECNVYEKQRKMTQIKFTIESDIASAFKARCADEGVSMTSVIRDYMKTPKASKGIKARTADRLKRRKTVADIIAVLSDVMEAEEAYCYNIPEQFEGRRETAEHTCDRLSEAITCLEEAY